MNIQRVLLTCALLPVFANAQSWSSCSSDLDDLRRRASDASSVASIVDSAHQRFKSTQEGLRTCLQSPALYDYQRDGCREKRSAFESATADYRSQLSTLESGLDDVNRKIRSSKDSCGAGFSQIETSPVAGFPSVPAAPGRRPAVDSSCSIFRGFKGQYPMATILTVCKGEMSEADCRACLAK